MGVVHVVLMGNRHERSVCAPKGTIPVVSNAGLALIDYQIQAKLVCYGKDEFIRCTRSYADPRSQRLGNQGRDALPQIGALPVSADDKSVVARLEQHASFPKKRNYM